MTAIVLPALRGWVNPPERTAASLFRRHLVALPLAGCAGAVAVFAVGVRPLLAWDPWLLDAAAVACGAAGLLLGGALGFSRGAAREAPAGGRARLRLAPAAGAVILGVAMTGLPSGWLAPAAVAAAAGLVSLAIAARRRRPQG